MDKYLVGLCVVAIFATGWLISYIAARFFFHHDRKRKAQLENKILSEDANATIIRRETVGGLYIIWGVHFIWLALTLGLLWIALNGPQDLEFDGSMRVSLDVAGAFTLMSVGCSWLATIEYGYIVTVINDKGIKQLKRGLTDYRLNDFMTWSEIEKIDMERDNLPRLFLRGQENSMAVFADCNNFSKLCKKLIGTVPREIFNHDSYDRCSMYTG